LTNVISVAAGDSHSLALTADGRVESWGWDNFGQTEVPASATNVVAVAAGFQHSLALTAAGTVVAWGRDDGGPTDVPADLTNVVAVAAGGLHSLALKADGTVVAWGVNDVGQCDVPPGLSNVIAIAAGYDYGLAIVGPAPPPVLLDPARCTNAFRSSLWTSMRGNYSLQFKTSLQETNWTPSLQFAGTGGARTLVDTNASAPQRFYRIRVDE
jgi:hypothetical protein